MKSIGTQIAIDMYNCSDLLLSDASGVQATIQSAAADFAMQPVSYTHLTLPTIA